jgi:hypothetical protein
MSTLSPSLKTFNWSRFIIVGFFITEEFFLVLLQNAKVFPHGLFDVWLFLGRI